MRRRLALTVGLALAACGVERSAPPARETTNPSIPSAMPGSGVTVPGSALSAMPVTGHGGPMRRLCGNSEFSSRRSLWLTRPAHRRLATALQSIGAAARPRSSEPHRKPVFVVRFWIWNIG